MVGCLNTSFATSCLIDVPVGRQWLDLTFEGSTRTAVTISSADAAIFGQSEALACFQNESSQLRSYAAKLLSTFEDAIQSLDFIAVPGALLKEMAYHPVCSETSGCLEDTIEALCWIVEHQLERQNLDAIASRIPGLDQSGAAGEGIRETKSLMKMESRSRAVPAVTVDDYASDTSDKECTAGDNAAIPEASKSDPAELPPVAGNVDLHSSLSSSAGAPDNTADLQQERELREQKNAWKMFCAFMDKSIRQAWVTHRQRPCLSRTEAAQRIQRNWRQYHSYKSWIMKLVRMNKACRTIQRVFRGHLARKRIKMLQAKETEMQCLLRRLTAHSRGYRVLKEKRTKDKVDLLDPAVIRAAITIQTHVRGWLARLAYARLLTAKKKQTAQRVKYLWMSIVKPSFDFNAVNLVRRLVNSHPAVLARCTFAEDVAKTCTTVTYTGASDNVSSRGFLPLFRETFTAGEVTNVLFQLTLQDAEEEATRCCRLRIFDNRNGSELPSAFGQPLATTLEDHALG